MTPFIPEDSVDRLAVHGMWQASRLLRKKKFTLVDFLKLAAWIWSHNEEAEGLWQK